MGKVLALASKDLRVLFAEKSNLFWVFVFPGMYALFFGAVFSGAGEGPSNMRVIVVDEDGSDFSQAFVSRLRSNEALAVLPREDANAPAELIGRADALERIRKGKVAAAVIIGKGFGEGFSNWFDTSDPKLQIASDPGRQMQGAYLKGLLAQAQFETMGERMQDRDWMRGQMQSWRSEMSDANDLELGQAKVFLDFFDAMDTFFGGVDDEVYTSGLGDDMLNIGSLEVYKEETGEHPREGFQITFPQTILWGILMSVICFAVSIVKERLSGTFARLCIGPLHQRHILAGKGLACFVTCCFVIVMLFTGGKLIFKVPIHSVVLFGVAAMCTAVCFVGLMMLISTLGKTEESVTGAGMAIIMLMAMFGGAMLPLFVMPTWMQRISHFSPVKWGILAMEGAIWRNFSVGEMLMPCGILLAAGAVFFGLGVVMLRRAQL
jgi:linearmycin/streptolysin S transport system permease protein